MTTEAECYRILGVEPGATIEEVRAAYRRAACEHHPDLQKDRESFEAERKLRELIAAYKFLARRLDPAAWNHRGENAKTFTPQDFARQGYRRQQSAEEFIDAMAQPGMFAPLRSSQAYPTRDETRTFIVLWILAVVVGIAFGAVVAAYRAHALGVNELPPGELLVSILVAEVLYGLLIAATVIGVVLTRKLVRITLRGYRWLFLPGPKPDRTLPEQAKQIDGN